MRIFSKIKQHKWKHELFVSQKLISEDILSVTLSDVIASDLQ